MIYRGEGGGGKRGGVGNGGFLGGHMVFSGKGGGVSVVANRVKRGGEWAVENRLPTNCQ